MLTTLSNIPIWVFPLFALLLITGLRARKDRRVPLVIIYAMPLLGLFTLRNIYSLSPPDWIWITAALGYLVGSGLGVFLQRDLILERGARFVLVKGEWITLLAMMIIFCAGFANGFLAATLPFVTSAPLFLIFFTAATCIPSGIFLGRAITTIRTAQTGTP